MKYISKNIILIIVIVSILLFVLTGCSSNADPEVNAYVCAIDVVENHLKCPSTATFCGYSNATVHEIGDNKYSISGYVDAQNSFGASIRETFYVTLTLTENGYKDASCEIY